MQIEGKKDHFIFLDYLRMGAAWAVVYDHVVARWPSEYGAHLRLVAMIRSYVCDPFGVIQDFGWMAVAVFFLISGFIITHVSRREQVGEFLIKRFFRIFPILALFVVVAVALNPQIRSQASVGDVLRNMTLLNYFMAPQICTVGVAWTLVIEVLFYIMTALTMFARLARLTLAVNLCIVVTILSLSRSFGADFFLFAASFAYIPYLVIGQIFYFALYDRSIGVRGAIVALVASFGVLLFGLRSMLPDFLPVNNSYLISFVYACGIFCVFFQLRHRLPPSGVVKFLADSSFAVYMVHGIIGEAVFRHVWAFGPRVAIAATLAITLAASAVIHLFVEKPILRIGRRLARAVRRGGDVVAVVS